MSAIFKTAADMLQEQRQNPRADIMRFLRERHPLAYFLGKLWRCPACKKTAKTAEGLTAKLCSKGGRKK